LLLVFRAGVQKWQLPIRELNSLVRSLSVAVAAILGGALLSACSTGNASGYTGNASGPTVASIGDSITALSADDIQATLGATYDVDVRGYSGDTIGQVLPDIQTIETTESPSRWILELGTDDAGEATAGKPTSWQSDLDTLFSIVLPASCVVMVNINLAIDNLGETTTVGAQINAAISAEVATHPNFKLINWASLAVQNPGWFIADGIHPNPVGQQALANSENLALSVCP
jgi:lysophospholipase L1-like esterase